MQNNEALTALAALAQETRLAVFRLLVQSNEAEGVPAGEIASTLHVAANTLSFHLSHLHHAGLVRSVRKGRSILYYANLNQFSGLLDFLTNRCGHGSTPGEDTAVEPPVSRRITTRPARRKTKTAKGVRPRRKKAASHA